MKIKIKKKLKLKLNKNKKNRDCFFLRLFIHHQNIPSHFHTCSIPFIFSVYSIHLIHPITFNLSLINQFHNLTL